MNKDVPKIEQLCELINSARKRDTATDGEGIKWLIELPFTNREIDVFNALTGWNAVKDANCNVQEAAFGDNPQIELLKMQLEDARVLRDKYRYERDELQADFDCLEKAGIWHRGRDEKTWSFTKRGTPGHEGSLRITLQQAARDERTPFKGLLRCNPVRIDDAEAPDSPQPYGWIPSTLRMPTEKDADKSGDVWWLLPEYSEHGAQRDCWNGQVADVKTFWMARNGCDDTEEIHSARPIIPHNAPDHPRDL